MFYSCLVELEADGFGPKPVWSAFVAKLKCCQERSLEKKIVGYVIHCLTYSSVKGKIMYLDDLFVLPGYRKQGIGRALMKTLVQVGYQTQEYIIRTIIIQPPILKL